MGPGTLFGNIGFHEGPLTHSAEAAPGTRICAFLSEDFQRIIAAYPIVMMRALSTLGNRLEDYERKLADTLVDAKEKVLNELRRYQHKRTSKFLERFIGEPSTSPLTHERLAKLTGLNRVTVTRAIHDLQMEGKISV